MTALNLNLSTANTPSTSGSYIFSVNQTDIIRQACLDNGALAEGEELTAQEFTDCSRKLNMLVKQWMGNTDFAPGLKVWTRRRGTLFLSGVKYLYSLGQTGDNWAASTTGLNFPQQYGSTAVSANAAAGATVIPVATTAALNIGDFIGFNLGSDLFWTKVANFNAVAGTVTIPAPGLPAGGLQASANVYNYTKKQVRPLSIIAAVLRDIYFNDTPLDLMTVQRYEALPTKAAPTNIADPTEVLYESTFTNQAPNGRLYIDCGGAQDVTKVIHITFLAPVQDLVNPGDAPDYPQQWYRPLVLGLSKEVCGMFEVAWDQSNEQCLQEALAIARQADPETTDVYFEPNASSPYEAA